MRVRVKLVRLCAAPFVVASLAAGCGGGGNGVTSPSPGGGTGGGTGGGSGGGSGGGGSVNTTTITISSSGVVTPNDITVAAGSRVTFINSSNANHEMNSDPHPTHEDCPAINQVGFISPGQTKQTGNLTEVRVCGFHDHNSPSNQNLKGVIRVTN
jgi:plastocyanin